jgi:hypothetical protein
MNTKSTFREYLQRPACGLSLAALLCLAARPAAAQTWDATADFSTTTGQNVLVNGVWSYGTYNHVAAIYANIPSGNYDPNAWLYLSGLTGLNGWYTLDNGGAGIYMPGIFKNNGSGPIFGLPVGEMGMHPAEPTFAVDHPVLLWTAPTSGAYQFNMGWNYYGAGDGVNVSMTRDLSGSGGIGAQVTEHQWAINPGAPTATLVQTFRMSAGETMAFSVNPVGNADSDTTGIALTVTKVPMGCWDANVDFSTTSATNVNGAWSYEWVNSSTSTGGLMDSYDPASGGANLNTWTTTAGASGIPAVIKNNDPANTYYGWAPGKLGMHPLCVPYADHSVIRWTAPSTGVYQVHVYAHEVGNAGSDGVDVSIYRNLAGSLTGSLWTDHLFFGWETYHDNVYSLTQGESLALVLGNGGAGSFGADSTTVEFVVTPLPLTSPVLWDARADFSATANANVNDVWSYEWANTSSSTAGLIANMDLNGFSNSGLNTWYVPGSPGMPDVMKNNGGFTYYGLTPGKLGVNPYVSAAPWNEAVIRWTAPSDGVYQFAAAWQHVGGYTSDGVNVSVQRNFTGSPAGSLWTTNMPSGGAAQWSGTYTLTKGESLAFVTGNGGVDNFGSDTTAVDIFVASAAATPLPVLSCTPSGNNLTLSWPVDVPGWTLESSTDLDAWDPVPGVVNNSVTVPMTEARQFFRLKQ